MPRMDPNERYTQLLAVAVEVAEEEGFVNLTHGKVAIMAGVVKGTVFHHFKTIEDLRNAVMSVAVRDDLKPIIAVGIATGNQVALDAPEDIKRNALLSNL